MRLNRREVTAIAVVLVVAVAIAGTAAYFLLRDSGGNATPPQLVVNVEQGTLRGQWLGAEAGKRFAAFRGIPYARPPLGALRFKAPRPPTPWSGVRDASDDGAVCLQGDMATGKVVGSEDCLYLNVYAPRAPDQLKSLLPVYFFIHGGAFILGSNEIRMFGPDFLLLQDIVVVTIKYRLDVFGFLNLDTEEVPGNAGIKDQIAALKWVHRNIAKFGGDPDRITIGGQSAGAVGAHLLTLLPDSRDLIQSAIIESGSALHSFGYNEENFDVALDLGCRLAGKNVTIEELSTLVLKLPANEIMTRSIEMVTERMAAFGPRFPYAVTPERRAHLVNGEKPLVTRSPETYIIDPSIGQKPLFMGMTSREWLLSYYISGYADQPNLMPFRIATLRNLIPENIIPYPDTQSYLDLSDEAAFFTWDDVLASVDKYFFHRNDTSCDLTCTFKKYLDDIYIGVDTTRLAELRARSNSSTTYVYRFAVQDQYNTSPVQDPEQLPDGAVHSDEMGYVWKMQSLQQIIDGPGSAGLASLTLRRMTNMWGSFIRTRTPTPKESVDGIWKPTELSTGVCCTGQMIYLNIGEELKVKEEYLGGPSMPFWLHLYQKYRSNKST